MFFVHLLSFTRQLCFQMINDFNFRSNLLSERQASGVSNTPSTFRGGALREMFRVRSPLHLWKNLSSVITQRVACFADSANSSTSAGFVKLDGKGEIKKLCGVTISVLPVYICENKLGKYEVGSGRPEWLWLICVIGFIQTAAWTTGSHDRKPVQYNISNGFSLLSLRHWDLESTRSRNNTDRMDRHQNCKRRGFIEVLQLFAIQIRHQLVFSLPGNLIIRRIMKTDGARPKHIELGLAKHFLTSWCSTWWRFFLPGHDNRNIVFS